MIEWFGTLTVYGWLDLGLDLLLACLIAAGIWDLERMHRRLGRLEQDPEQDPDQGAEDDEAYGRHAARER